MGGAVLVMTLLAAGTLPAAGCHGGHLRPAVLVAARRSTEPLPRSTPGEKLILQ
ncbi:hypothetical protein QJS66_11480 [Kocuria rhizophila]|nr:hypothetical protein QJS66_11480 [Kocuria rhizophila]